MIHLRIHRTGHAVRYFDDLMAVLKNGGEKVFNLKMCDWDKVFGNPKSSFIINAIILNTKKVIYMNIQTGKEMHVNLVKYHVPC